MTSPTNRRVVSQSSLERQNSKDDPWCLTCGVNLALDGRTYTVVTRHSNGDLCDIFTRVLGAEFSEDYASVNVCNRCERQLRRLGRYNSIVLARDEGVTLRQQLEKNLSKHGQEVVVSGHSEDLPVPATDTETFAKGETLISSSTGDKRQGFERHSNIKRPGKYTSRSVSSVHFEDKEEAGRRKALVRKYSAPEGLRKRESVSPFSDAERRREARRRKWSSASSTSEENAITAFPIPPDRKLSLGQKTSPLVSYQQRYVEMSDQTEIPSGQQELSDEVIRDNSSVTDQPTDEPLEASPSDANTEQQEVIPSEEQELQTDRNADHEETLTRMDTIQADDELFKTLDEDVIRESSNESGSEADPDADAYAGDVNADSRSCMSEVEERITTKTKFKGAYYNIGSTEDLLAEFANERDRERATWSRLTFTESIDVGDGGDDPVRPPRRKSVRSLIKKRSGQRQDGTKENDVADPQQIKEECESSPDGTEPDRHNDIKANGVLSDNHESSDKGTEGKTVATFEMETPEGADLQTAPETPTTKSKTEKSPLIGKDGGSSNLQVRNGSRMKKQLKGVLCCHVL